LHRIRGYNEEESADVYRLSVADVSVAMLDEGFISFKARVRCIDLLRPVLQKKHSATTYDAICNISPAMIVNLTVVIQPTQLFSLRGCNPVQNIFQEMMSSSCYGLYAGFCER
jgi:hypothetical protein